MVSRSLRCGLLLGAALPTQATNARETPVDKVITLLNKLSKQVAHEGKEEAAEYDKFACFCKEQASGKLYAIEKSEKEIKAMDAKIEKLEAEITKLDEEVTVLGERIDEITTIVDEKEADRKTEHEEYVEESDDIKDAIKAIDKAMDKLTGAKEDLEGDVGDKLLQTLTQVAMHSRRGSQTAGNVQSVIALMQSDKPNKDGVDHAYNYKSTKVTDILRNLRRDFKTELKQVDDDEHEKKAAHEKKMLALNNEKKFKDEEKTEKEELSAEKSEELSETQEDRDEEDEAKTLDQEFLDELTVQCEEKATVWDQRSKTRAGELTALSKAIEAMEKGAAGNYDSVKLLAKSQTVAHPSKANVAHKSQTKMATAFLQIHSASDGKAAVVAKVEKMLDRAATHLKSEYLQKVVSMVQMRERSFESVLTLVENIITKLEDEASADDSEEFCSNGMEEAEKTRDDNNIVIDEKEADIAKDQAKNKALQAEIDELYVELSGEKKSIAEAQELRDEEKATNEKTVSDCEEGKEATQTALTVLKEFYEGAAFVQARGVQARGPKGGRDGKSVDDLIPETSFDGDYKGKQEKSEGIIGLIEEILDDFDKTIEDTESAEEDAQKAFEEENGEVLDNIDQLSSEIDGKESEVKENNEAVMEAKDDIEEARELRDNALLEMEKLKVMCAKFKERREKREEEIQALKDAKALLEEFDSK